MTKITKALEYGRLVAGLFLWIGAFNAACLVSAQCRKIRAELAAEGEVIDPVRRILPKLDRLHAELFGVEE
jgi:hypothetical protein